MSERILVTGGAGFLGSAWVRRLVAVGAQVRVFDNESRGSYRRLDDLGDAVEHLSGDIRDPEAVDRAVQGMDSVWHFAFINGTRTFYEQPELVLEVGVKGMLHVLDSAIRHGVSRLFVASSSEVYQTPPLIPTPETVPLSIPDPLNPRYSYAGGKIISELLSLNYGRSHFDRVVVFRPHNVYGPDMGYGHVVPQFVERLRQLARCPDDPLPFPIEGSGDETRAFVYVDDFVDGLLLLREHGEHLGIYHVGNDEETPIRVLAETIARLLGRRIVLQPGPAPVGGTRRRCPDIGKLRALGYAPRVSLESGLAKVLAWNGRETTP